MQLTSIHAIALKGRTFTHLLAPLTVVAGPNDAGKSAVADAVRLALIGYLPEHGKTNSATFALCSGSRLLIEAHFHRGPQISREWKKTGKQVKYTGDGPTEAPLVMLDANEYFGKSDSARVDMLFAVLNPKDFTPEAITAKIKAAVAEHGVLDELPELLDQGGDNIEQWISLVDDALDTAKAEAAANARRFAGTIQGIVQLRASDPLIDGASLQQETLKLDRDLATATQRLGELKQQAQSATANESRRNDRVYKIAQLRVLVGDTAVTDDLAELEAQRQECERELRVLREAHAVAQERHRGAEAKRARADIVSVRLREQLAIPQPAKDMVATLQNEIDGLPVFDVSAAQQAYAKAHGAAESIRTRSKTNDEAKQRAAKFRDTHLGESTCPTCGTAGADFHEAIDTMYQRRIAELDQEVVAIEREFQAAQQELGNAELRRNEALRVEKERQRLERSLGEAKLAEKRAADAMAMILQYRQELEQIGIVTTTPPEAPPEIAATQRRLDHLEKEKARAEAAARMAELQAELDALPPPAAELDEAIYSVECGIDAIDAQRTEVQANRRKLDAQLADERTSTDAKEKQEAELTREQLIKVARDTLATERARIIDEAFRPLLDRVNTFTAGILPTPLEFREGELGRFNGPSWVPVRCFGGAHTAVTYAGLQTALASQAPAKIVIVDELGRLDGPTKEKFLANVGAALKAGLLDQFIGIDVDPGFYLTAAETVRFTGLNLIEVKR